VRDIDLLVFAAAGQDLIEPATAHILQQKLGTRAAVFDVKNACNSFLIGVELAESLIAGGRYGLALVATGEVNSRGIHYSATDNDDFRRLLPALTLGDGGGAALLAPSTDGRGIFYRRFVSHSEFWPLATVPGGGSMHPRGDEWLSLRGDGARLRDAFVEHGPAVVQQALDESGMGFDDFDRILVHQTSVPQLGDFVRATGAPADRIEVTVPCYGNLASASLPIAYSLAAARGVLGPGSRALWIGMASGLSVGVLMTEQ
jgi:3-oxoacyl-[acyl-carrier-protein] synthase-3